VPPQDVITRDNVSVKVNAVIYFRVFEPRKAIVEVENYIYATSQLAQTTLRSGCWGQVELDELLAARERLNHQLQSILDAHTGPVGDQDLAVEVKHVDLPEEMRRAMAKQAEAEREKRAKIISRLRRVPGRTGSCARPPTSWPRPRWALTLRYLQTADRDRNREELDDHLPLPIDLISLFLKRAERSAAP